MATLTVMPPEIVNLMAEATAGQNDGYATQGAIEKLREIRNGIDGFLRGLVNQGNQEKEDPDLCPRCSAEVCRLSESRSNKEGKQVRNCPVHGELFLN